MCYFFKKNYLCSNKSEDKLRLGSKNKQAYFILLSTCIIFAN